MGSVERSGTLHSGRRCDARDGSATALAQFPHLMVAPFIAAVIWHGLFKRPSG
ncbi:hypothetical protein [uncultured Bradyrhizobium sp.]|uniref:hypothetical protein n=1 Tax=uncultured Bradyrhizobium sp. TaxID=199684 RepID=UPI0035C94AEA